MISGNHNASDDMRDTERQGEPHPTPRCRSGNSEHASQDEDTAHGRYDRRRRDCASTKDSDAVAAQPNRRQQ